PPPKITVEIEQPEIIVRMPDPEVDVAIAEPDVQVSVPTPQVHVVQPEQPQVRINAAEPVVSLTPRHTADIAIERSQPQVRYERLGEPKLFVRQADGAPRLRFEEMSREEALQHLNEATRSAIANTRSVSAQWLEGLKIYSAAGEDLGEAERVLV